ncbi:MAG: hypothetical protein V7741_09910, partial [Hyphomonas sp.]
PFSASTSSLISDFRAVPVEVLVFILSSLLLFAERSINGPVSAMFHTDEKECAENTRNSLARLPEP